MIFTADHIRTLASWAEKLRLTGCQEALFTLYHEMVVLKTAPPEKVNAMAMSAIHVIRDTEKDKEMFWATMSAWGITSNSTISQQRQ